MKRFLCALTATGMLLAGNDVTAEEGQWYIGGSAASYYLDSKRDLMGGDQESVTLGPQIGYISNDGTAVELGYSKDIGGDDLQATSLSVLHKFGDPSGVQPYMLGGLSHFETDLNTADDNTTVQMHFGVGLSKMISEAVELRGDVRGFWGPSDDYADAAVTLGLNYMLGAKKAAPEPVAEVAKPVVTPEPEMRTITVRLNVEFEFDKAVVRAIYGDELNAIANAMKEHDDILLVLEGHTDSKGSDEYNQSLSERRAAAVKAKLVEDYQIPADRISSVGYGESRPIADNGTDEGRAMNRRVIGEMSFTEVDGE